MSERLIDYIRYQINMICSEEETDGALNQRVAPIVFEILGPPLIKKNSKNSFRSNSGHMVVIGSEKYEDNIEGQIQQIIIQKQQKVIKEGLKFPIEKHCFIMYDFYLNRKTKCDTNNLIANPDDILQTAGVIKDDFQLVHLPCPRIWAPKDQCKEKTVITLLIPEFDISDFSGKWYREHLCNLKEKELAKEIREKRVAENRLKKLEKENAKQNKKIEKISKAVIPSAPAEVEVEELEF